MNNTKKTIGESKYSNLLLNLSTGIEDYLFDEIRKAVKQQGIEINEEDLGEIVSDVLRTSYFAELPKFGY
jgi:hypothetical protein